MRYFSLWKLSVNSWLPPNFFLVKSIWIRCKTLAGRINSCSQIQLLDWTGRCLLIQYIIVCARPKGLLYFGVTKTTWILRRRKEGQPLSTGHLLDGRNIPDRLAPKVLLVQKACFPRTRWDFYSSHLISCHCWLGRAPYQRKQVLSVQQTSWVAQLEKWQALHSMQTCKSYTSILNPVEKISICVD